LDRSSLGLDAQKGTRPRPLRNKTSGREGKLAGGRKRPRKHPKIEQARKRPIFPQGADIRKAGNSRI